MNVNSFNINITDMPNVETVRQFSVNGEIGAEFQIIALQNPASSSTHTLYYDFLDNTFESGHNDSNNNLTITLSSTTYTNKIIFPSGGGEYVIKLTALNNTTIKGKKSNVISKSISKQATAAEITFKAGTANTNNYETFPETTSTGSLGSSASVEFNWDVTNSDDHATLYSFGLFQSSTTPFDELNLLKTESLIETSIGKAWYFETTETVDGAVTASTEVKVDDLTDLAEGMFITGVSGGDSLSGTPFIKSIDIENKTLSISTVQTFSNDITLTFKAYGSSIIYKAIGVSFEFDSITISPTKLTKTVRADVSSSTSVTLTNTLGIAGGNVVKYTGVGVDNSSSNLVTSVTPDADGTGSDGVIVVQLAQTLEAGTELSFKGSFAVINFKGSLRISSFPETDKTIYLDLDKFLAVGSAS